MHILQECYNTDSDYLSHVSVCCLEHNAEWSDAAKEITLCSQRGAVSITSNLQWQIVYKLWEQNRTEMIIEEFPII